MPVTHHTLVEVSQLNARLRRGDGVVRGAATAETEVP
jgi:hypothetical protein